MEQSGIREPLVITGAGVVSAIGIGKEASLSALQSLRSGIGEVQYLKTVHHELPVGEVKLSNAEMQQMVWVPADGDEPLSRTTLMARLAIREALSQAGLLGHNSMLRAEVDGTIPFISGTTVAGMDQGENLFTLTDHDIMIQQMLDAATDCGSNTLQIARGFGHFAMFDTLSTACSSAANAIVVGANLLKTGRFEQVLVGGTESLSRFHLNGFNSLKILDHEQCRPFDASRAGLNLGEGAAYLVIEKLSSANKRGAEPLAVLSGYGNACDAFHQTASSADGEGAYLAMSQAIAMAGLSASDINYVNAHGTGTPNNDSSELIAMQRIFGSASVMPPYSSTKSFTGHTTSASGSIEAVFCLLALQHQFLPISLGCSTPIEGQPIPCDVNTSLPTHGLRHVLCNSFGFGGNDSSLLFSHTDTLTDIILPDSTPAFPRAVCIVAETKLGDGDADPDFMKYMTIGEARRLGPMLKRALAVSLQTLCDAGQTAMDGTMRPFVPDAIITGTTWGNVESSESFLREVLTGGEQMLRPTPFMLSTHNTISSLIAINTRNHGYNNTHSQGRDSLRMAMLDALMLLQLGMIDNALVGLHDSLPTRINEAYLLVAKDALPPGVKPLRSLEL